jgi:V/A-type H+-transporting ATPase subunit E
MGLEELKQEIVDKAVREADSILASAKEEASKITREAQAGARLLQKKAAEAAGKAAEAAERMELSKAEFEVKKQLLNRKQEMVNKVFAAAAKSVKEMNAGENAELFQKLLGKARGQMEIATLYINKKDKDLARDYSWLSTDISGGFIAENRDRTVRIDYSYGTFLENVKNRSLSEIVKVLFG